MSTTDQCQSYFLSTDQAPVKAHDMLDVSANIGSGGTRRSGRLRTSVVVPDEQAKFPDAKGQQSPSVSSSRARQIPNLSEQAMRPLTDQEREEWKGWAELLSEPDIFNYILQEYGVKDVQVQDAFLAEEFLANLPQPIYGLVFLFKYREEDNQEDDAPKCPKDIWFANQTIPNACATVALLNIVMNVPEIDIGGPLTAFKAETRLLRPPYRGQRLGCNEFIRHIHNSFASRMDILSADWQLAEDKSKYRPKRNLPQKSARKNKAVPDADDDTLANHYIAYVPINGSVWQLDGLQRQPTNIGSFQCSEDWLQLVAKNINERSDVDSHGKTLMALCKSPRLLIAEKLAQSIKTKIAIEEALLSVDLDRKSSVVSDALGIENRCNDALEISPALNGGVEMPASTRISLLQAGGDLRALEQLHRNCMADQLRLRKSLADETDELNDQKQRAISKRQDFAPIIYKCIKELAEQDVLKDIIHSINSCS